MKISFIRHGRLDRTIEPMTVTSFHEWMKGYDLHTITKKHEYLRKQGKRLKRQN